MASKSLFAFGFIDIGYPIRFPSLRGNDDDSIPLGSSNNNFLWNLTCHHGERDPSGHIEWAYDLHGLAFDATCLSGTISGFEAYCPKSLGCRMPSDNQKICRLPEGATPVPNLRCHPIHGSFKLSPTDDVINLTIDRGDGPEEFVGGWGHGFEFDAPKLDPNAASNISNHLMLRSKRTGLQVFMFQHFAGYCPKPRP